MFTEKKTCTEEHPEYATKQTKNFGDVFEQAPNIPFESILANLASIEG